MQLQVKTDTLKGIVLDTIVKVSDTINLNLSNSLKLYQGDEQLIVKTISEPMSGIEEWGLWIGLFAAIITVIYTLFALKKLLSNDEQLQSQINELVKLNQLFERKLRMSVKPLLLVSGAGSMGRDRTLKIYLYNKGEAAYYTGHEFIEGEENVTITEWDRSVEIEKDNQIILSGESTVNPQSIDFKMVIKYFDKEKYEYESTVEWNQGVARITETREL